MIPPVPSPTPTWHNDTYPSISPTRPELSVNGKTVIITGAGSGIGREAASTFARAGAKKLVLIGRTEASLIETKKSLALESCSIHAVSVSDEKAVSEIAASVGTWDIMILNAAFLSNRSPIASSTVDDWWQSFETNVKGTMIMAKAFLPTANPSHAAILGLTTGFGIALPASRLAGLSAYSSSKLALTKFLEFLAAENPNVFVATIHPGLIDTKTFRKSGAKAESMPMDTMELTTHFMLWLTSPEAAFLKGRIVWVNWDVNELKAMAKEIQSGQKLTTGTIGWPFPDM